MLLICQTFQQISNQKYVYCGILYDFVKWESKKHVLQFIHLSDLLDRHSLSTPFIMYLLKLLQFFQILGENYHQKMVDRNFARVGERTGR